jgi:hypothetical protein
MKDSIWTHFLWLQKLLPLDLIIRGGKGYKRRMDSGRKSIMTAGGVLPQDSAGFSKKTELFKEKISILRVRGTARGGGDRSMAKKLYINDLAPFRLILRKTVITEQHH